MKGPVSSLPRSATIADVAREANVSVRTVSRVLNNSPRVGQETRAEIDRAISRLDFSRSLIARGLAARRSFLLGVVQGDQNDHVIGRLQHGIVEVCQQSGYELLVHPVDVADPRLVDNLDDFVRRTQVDGLLLLSPVSELPAIPLALARRKVAAVGIASVRVAGFPVMLVSREREAAADIANCLIGLGHRRIAMVTGPMRFHSARERAEGFGAALLAADLPLAADLVVEGDYGFASGSAAANRLLSLPERPTAIFAGNDIMAAAILKTAAERGIAVPRQLSVAGFDDAGLAAMVSPSLTTIRRPLHDIAREATRRVIALVEGKGEQVGDYEVELTLVQRQSTSRAPV